MSDIDNINNRALDLSEKMGYLAAIGHVFQEQGKHKDHNDFMLIQGIIDEMIKKYREMGGVINEADKK